MSAIINSLRNLAGSSRNSPAGDSSARFGVIPGNEGPGEGGFTEWLHAMRLVARLPAGVPQHFRKKLWLTLSERYLTSRGVEWTTAERDCFRGTALPDDAELGAQILKDLHRTGCSLFCGTEGRENQAMLRRVLLAYARWNKEVGYCQGFNMLAAIILEVMDKSESDSLKVMIYLVEAVLPEGYFADDLRGLSADMAAFRDLLRLRLPRLATHMDHLQKISDGGGIEPPLPDVFTMQWFLTLYATWLPRESLLRIWDLILLDGNEVLLLTALAIWDILQDRILSARSADEFYSCMGGGSSAIYEAGETLVAKVVALGSAPELPRLRNIHRYKVTPPVAPPLYQPPLHSAMQSMTKRGLRLFYSEDEGESSDDGNKLALAMVFPRREERSGTGDRLSLDIGALKRQYARLRERQRQAHVILAAACARHAAVGVPTSPTSLTVNNLLLGKSAIVSSRGRRLGPPPGAVPPTRHASSPNEKSSSKSKGRTSETISWNDENKRKTLSRRNSLKWKDIKKDDRSNRSRKASIDLDESGDGVIVSDSEASAMIASVRIRGCSESSSYSSHSSSSSDTSLCDENDNASDAEHDLVDRGNKNVSSNKPLAIPEISESNISTPLADSTLQTETRQETQRTISNIDDYLDSVAGEPLRTYIDGFEDKCKDEIAICTEINLGNNSNNLQSLTLKDPVLRNSPFSEVDITQTSNVLKPLNFTELSPLSPPNCSFSSRDYQHTYQNRFSQCHRPITITRPPDVIDSLTKYPNFVPDIDLSDKISSECDSPSHSPDNESVIVSEDEPPIPLKIDKYFEHSPEFFGARITDPNSVDIPSRRTARRDYRTPKKPDSLTLTTSHNDTLSQSATERASSLPQSHSSKSIHPYSPYVERYPKDNEFESIDRSIEQAVKRKNFEILDISKTSQKTFSPKDFMLQSGRKNSEKALQIIQENSKILNRILTKQSNNVSEESNTSDKNVVLPMNEDISLTTELDSTKKYTESSILKESISDSVIRYRKKELRDVFTKTPDFTRSRPISIDDPSSLDARLKCENLATISSNGGIVNRTDLYGWENKGFLAKYNLKTEIDKSESQCEYDFKIKSETPLNVTIDEDQKRNVVPNFNRHSYSGDMRPSKITPSTVPLDFLYERKIISDDSSFLLSKKYNDFVLSKASDICSQMVTQEPKCGDTLKTDNSQVSDFANIVTSSISFTYEPSQEDDSPIGAKSNSSDTLCQITSLDQVSTPISPKIFPNRESLPQSKDCLDKSEKTKVESESTCSAITSLLETDTLSSLSCPRSPSTGSFHPFPTRQSMRVKELGIKLGMYPKESISSPPK